MDPKYTRNRYYVGSNSVVDNREWGHRDLAGATNHAKKLLDEDDEDEVFIVKIVRVVKRADRPIQIIDLDK